MGCRTRSVASFGLSGVSVIGACIYLNDGLGNSRICLILAVNPSGVFPSFGMIRGTGLVLSEARGFPVPGGVSGSSMSTGVGDLVPFLYCPVAGGKVGTTLSGLGSIMSKGVLSCSVTKQGRICDGGLVGCGLLGVLG